MSSMNQRRLEQDEAELEALLKQQRGEPTEEETKTEAVTDETNEETPEVDAEETKPEDTTDWKKRYSDLRSHTAKKEKERQDEIDELKASLSASSSTPAGEIPQTQKELSEWREKNPQAARILEALIQEEADKKFQAAKIDLDEIKADRQKLTREKAEAAIRAKHSDFETIKASDDFHDWAEAQPQVIQDALYKNSNDAASVVSVLTLYKAEKGITAKPKNASAADAVSVKGGKPSADPEAGQSKKIRESDVEKMSASEYEKRAAEIDAAIASGNFIFDRSKKR